MRTLAIACQKGGTGKSTSCLAIGQALARKGNSILYVDLDPQGNLSYTLKGSADKGSVLAAIQRPSKAKGELQEIEGGALLASSPSLSGADAFLTDLGKEYRLKEALEALPAFDFCLVDTPPSLGILTINALSAAEAIIAPTQADMYSLHGIRQLAATVEAVRAYTNKTLSFMGLLVTRYNGRAIIRKDIAEMLEALALEMGTRVFKTKIRECTALVEAAAMRQSIFAYAPKSNGAKDYAALTEEVITILNTKE